LTLPDDFTVPACLLKQPWNFDEKQARDVICALLDTMRANLAVELDIKKGVGLQWNALGFPGPNMRVGANAPNKKADLKSWEGKTGRRAELLRKFLRASTTGDNSDAIDIALREIWDILKDYDRSVDLPADKILISAGDAYRLNARYYRLKLVSQDENLLICGTCKRLCHLSVGPFCPRHKCPGRLIETTRNALERNHYRDSYEQDVVGVMRVEEHTAQLDSEKARAYQRDFKEGKINVLSCSTTFELGVDLGDLDTIFLRNVPPEAFNYDQRVGRSGRRRGHPGFAITFCKRGPHDLYHFADPLGMLMGRVKPPILAIKNPKIVLRHLTAYALSSYFREGANGIRFASVESLFANLENPTFASDFMNFLTRKEETLKAVFEKLVPQDDSLFQKLGLQDGSWISLMTGANSKLENAQREIANDYNSVRDFELKAKESSDYKMAQWAKNRAQTIAAENVLNFLSRKTIIPKYGFPVDVVALETNATDNHSVGLDRDLSIAISEFAPGSQLIANKKLWTSYGVKKVKNKELETKHYFRCQDHNVFKQWATTAEKPVDMGCSCIGQTGIYVIPIFGFTTSTERPAEPKGRVTKLFSNRPYFAYDKSTSPEEISVPAHAPLVSVTRTMPGIMVVLCEGKKREAFRICSACGMGSYQKPKKTSEPHKDPYGRKCSGTLQKFSLGHEFETDIVKLTFSHPTAASDKLWFAYSLSSALVEAAAEVLEVPASDISATVGPVTAGSLPAIIVYDNVPGGAGLVAKLETEKTLIEVLKVAQKRVSGICHCNPDTSCYGCLRSYRNQFVHEQLQRGPVDLYLKEILEKLKVVPAPVSVGVG
jgi:hypothetical protein